MKLRLNSIGRLKYGRARVSGVRISGQDCEREAWSGHLYSSSAFAETDRDESFAVGARREYHFVAVFQIPATFTIRQAKRLGMFHEASPAVVRWTRYSPAAQEVTGLQVAAVAGVVRDHLGEAPIGVLEVRCDDANRSFARFAHP